MRDKEIIKEIEKVLEVKLNKLNKIEWNSLGYILNEAFEVTDLILSGCINNSIKFEKLIPILKSLTNLRKLYLSSNKIININLLSELKDLTHLYLQGNNITDINFLSEFQKLNELNLVGNSISDLFPLKGLNNIHKLFLSFNKIKDISPLKNLTKIQQLSLSNNQITDISPLSKLRNLHELYLSCNLINSLSDCKYLLDIDSLTKLQIDNNPFLKSKIIGIKTGPDQNHLKHLYKELKDQTGFSISENNYFGLVTKKINDCYETKSVFLDLGCMGITDLSFFDMLFECTHLETLILSNEWAEYSEGKWIKMKSSNDLDKNKLTSIPRQIGKLKNLKVLICGGDWYQDNNIKEKWGIDDISNLYDLTKIEFLNISNNQIKNTIALSNFKHLKIVHLNNNKIKKVLLKEYNTLQEIYLSNNVISDVHFLKDLKEVQTVDLHSNKIRSLKPLENFLRNNIQINITNTKWVKNTINIAKNPLVEPSIETINIGKEAVLRYFDDIKLGNVYINNEIKLILVGNSEVGKSTLVKYLDNEKDIDKPHSPTHWMEERTVKSKHNINKLNSVCDIRIFDFGGHDYYHDTQHLFYTTNALYILLWESKTNCLKLRLCNQQIDGDISEIGIQDYPLRYWLDAVSHFIKEKPSDIFNFKVEKEDDYNGSILVVQNKVTNKDEIIHLNNAYLSKKYPFIYDFLNINIIKEPRNLNHFNFLLNEMINKTKLIGAKLPEYQGKIKKYVESYSDLKTPILSFEEFKIECSKIVPNITNEQVKDACCYLKQIGLILYYPENSNDRIYVNKNWVIKNIYNILKGLIKKRGEFDRNHIKKSMSESVNNETISSLIQLMKDFKIIFEHPDNSNYIAPLYLPMNPSDDVKLFLVDNRIPYRRFEYNGFIHKQVILDFFQEFGKLTLSNDTKKYFYYWKNGLIIKNKSSDQIILIEFNIGNEEGNAYIDIIELNKKEEAREFLNEIVLFIKKINKNYEIDELITLDGIDFISLEILNENARNGKLIFVERKKRNKGEMEIFNKPEIILKNYTMYLNETIKKKNIVISYSKKDLAFVDTFIRYLKPLEDKNLINPPWYCTLEKPGDEWDSKIQSKFAEADIVCFMISEYFYSTDYIVEKEIKVSIDRYNKDKTLKIIPIILEHYDWARPEPYNLKKFTAIPYQGKPITDFKNQKLAWFTVSKSIELMIERDIDTANSDKISRDLQELYERQVKGKLDDNV